MFSLKMKNHIQEFNMPDDAKLETAEEYQEMVQSREHDRNMFFEHLSLAYRTSKLRYFVHLDKMIRQYPHVYVEDYLAVMARPYTLASGSTVNVYIVPEQMRSIIEHVGKKLHLVMSTDKNWNNECMIFGMLYYCDTKFSDPSELIHAMRPDGIRAVGVHVATASVARVPNDALFVHFTSSVRAVEHYPRTLIAMRIDNPELVKYISFNNMPNLAYCVLPRNIDSLALDFLSECPQLTDVIVDISHNMDVNIDTGAQNVAVIVKRGRNMIVNTR